jgi:hypothetical protein
MTTQKTTAKKPLAPKMVPPTGVALIDGLIELSDSECTIDAYVRAASEYIKRSRDLKPGPQKACQIRLSHALGRALKHELQRQLPQLARAHVGERKVSGALRTVNADVSDFHPTDGLRLAVELKPVNLAVGRAIWNRFGDIRTFAVNLHLKFPFCVVGGVLAIPTYEETGTKAATRALQEEDVSAGDIIVELAMDEERATDELPSDKPSSVSRKPTIHLIERAVSRLMRAGGRKTEGDAPHLLEGIAVVIYDPDTGELHATVPPVGSGLRWEEFVRDLVAGYQGRFED